MNYTETIDYLFTRLPMYSRIGAAAYRKDLTNTIAVCQFLGNPQTKFKSIHVAGTNGKGSTSHMLAAVFQSAGYKTGLYTSPHLKDFRERIRINGSDISEAFIVDFVSRIQPLIEQLDPSFFEITVAMAFEYFAKESVDIAIVEVGLGGRLDSTNIIIPELSIITNISFDHMNLLGDTLQKIAVEKAGIIKKNKPVIIGEFHPLTHGIFEQKALESESPIFFADRSRFVSDWKTEHHALVVEVTDLALNEKTLFSLDLPGVYQSKNLLTVLEAIQHMQAADWSISHTQLLKGLSQVKKTTGLHGRWEQVHRNPDIVLDVAHNEDGIRQLTRQIEVTDHEELHIVLGLVKDKEIDKILDLLPRHAHYYFTKAQIPRAIPEDELAAKAMTKNLKGKYYSSVTNALQAAVVQARKKDLILVCGSVFVVGEVNMGEIKI